MFVKLTFLLCLCLHANSRDSAKVLDFLLSSRLRRIAIVCSIQERRPKTVRIYKFGGVCPGNTNTPIYLTKVRIGLVNKINTISMKAIFKETITRRLKLKLTLKRCQSREILDSCEKYQGVTINHFCDLLNAENTPWSPFVELADPPFRCPLVKGVHWVKNGTFDGSAFANFPVSGWYWIVMAKLTEYETNRTVMCMTMEGQVVTI